MNALEEVADAIGRPATILSDSPVNGRAAHGAGASRTEPELTAEQNQIVAALGRKLKATASVARGLAAMSFISIVPTVLFAPIAWGIAPLLLGLYLAFVAKRTHVAAVEFAKVVRSTGSDLTHLMTALVQLHELYRLKIYLVLIVLAIGLLLAVAGPAA